MKQLFRALFHWLEGKDPLNLPPEYVNELDMEWIEGTRKRLVEKRFRSQPEKSSEAPESIEMIPRLMRGGLRQSLNGVGQNEVSRTQRTRWFEVNRADDEDWSKRVEESLLASQTERRLRQQAELEATYSQDYAREWIERMQNSGYSQDAIELPGQVFTPESVNGVESSSVNIYDHLVESENKWAVGLPQYQFGETISESVEEVEEEEESWCDGVFESGEQTSEEAEATCDGFDQSADDESEFSMEDNDDINLALDEELDLAHIEENRSRIQRELEELLKVDALAEPRVLTPCLAFGAASPELRRARGNRDLMVVEEGVFTNTSTLPVDVSECLLFVPETAAVDGSNAKQQIKKSGKKKTRGGSRRSSGGKR